MKDQTRLTLVRGGFILLVLLFFASGVLVDPLTGFIFQPAISAGGTLVRLDLTEPGYTTFPEAGVLVVLGAFVWCLAAKRAPYLQRMAILLGVALLVSLGIAVTLRWRVALGCAQATAITGFAPLMTNRPIGWVPLGGGFVALAIGAVMGLAGYLSRRATREPEAGDSQ